MHVPNEAKRAYAVKPFYRGKKVTVIGAISFQRVVALMTIDNSMDSQAFEVFIAQCLVPQLWSGAVVVMDNLPAHKVDSIKPMIEAVGASILCLSPYSPDFNPVVLFCKGQRKTIYLVMQSPFFF
ncbi:MULTISPECIES: transposase [unclassified Microcoleus]|uniref:transposase n=1 Tax=unclassified Microcoleus TaxID=2642155 RepID=UPI003B1E3B6D